MSVAGVVTSNKGGKVIPAAKQREVNRLPYLFALQQFFIIMIVIFSIIVSIILIIGLGKLVHWNERYSGGCSGGLFFIKEGLFYLLVPLIGTIGIIVSFILITDLPERYRVWKHDQLVRMRLA